MKRLIAPLFVFLTGFMSAAASLGAGPEPVDPLRLQAKAHTELGTAYFQGGRMGTALDEVASALAADSNYAPAYNLAGLVNMYLRETDKARDNFQRALRLAPDDAEINNNYGWLLCQEGREKEAFPLFMHAVKNPLYTTPTKPFFNAGMCALRLKDDALAEEYLSRAVMADPNNVQAYFRLAELKYRTNNLYDAQRLIAVVMRTVDSDPAAIWLALRIDRKLGNRQSEMDYATQLRRKFQGSPEYQAMTQGRFE